MSKSKPKPWLSFSTFSTVKFILIVSESSVIGGATLVEVGKVL